MAAWAELLGLLLDFWPRWRDGSEHSCTLEVESDGLELLAVRIGWEATTGCSMRAMVMFFVNNFAVGRKFSVYDGASGGVMPRSNSGLRPAHFFDGYVHRHRRSLQRSGFVYFYAVIFQGLLIRDIFKAVFFRIFGNDGGRNHLGHVIFGFIGQAIVVGKFPKTFQSLFLLISFCTRPSPQL